MGDEQTSDAPAEGAGVEPVTPPGEQGEPMDIHKPKAAHSWREFAIEIGTIICGILIALSLEQGIEWLHWRHEVEKARESIAYDLRRAIGAAAEKDATSPCTAVWLGNISDALDQAQATKRLPPLNVPTPLSLSWTIRSWSSLTSGQTLAHLPNRDLIALDTINGTLAYLQRRSEAERDAWAVLSVLSGPGRPTSDAEIAQMRAALGQAYYAASDQRIVSRNVETFIARTGLIEPAKIDAAYQEGLKAARTPRICNPPSAPEARTRDVFGHYLTGAPVPPGEWKVAPVGVGGALTTDR
jgi:hypothetical protein